jgi:uncharacterized protein YgiB involved in biofilm formation
MGKVISLETARKTRSSKVISLAQLRQRALYSGMSDVEEATAALYSAANKLAKAGWTQEAQDCLDLGERVVKVRRVLPQGLGPQAA